MIHDVVAASYKGGYEIEVTFDDGNGGVVDFSSYLDKGGIFDRFKDIAFFANFTINQDLGVLTWHDEIDIAPETLYAEATRSPLPDWMESRKKPSARRSMQQTRSSRG
jgi:hypothetical protein